MLPIQKKSLSTLIAVAVAFPTCGIASEIYTPVVGGVSPAAADVVPNVAHVPGKQFTDSRDMNYVPSPHQVSGSQIGEFDGQGGARNGLRLADFNPELGGLHVDAQSQIRDRLFEAAVANRAPLIVSTSFDQMLKGNTSLAAERTGGAAQSFATSSQVVSHPHLGGRLRDINSVDLWGPEGSAHAAYYSFGGDSTGVAVYSMVLLAPGAVQPYLTSGEIAAALGNRALAPLIDVDAMMVHDVGTGFNPFDGNFGPGDSIMFSIAPIPQPDGGPDFFDGGEIWVWEHGSQAEFLDHGDHLWNTAFDVQGTFGALSENVDALEVAGVPEPTTMILALLGLASMFGSNRQRSA